MNSKHRNVKFTVERENNNSLSLLDIKNFRDSGKFQISLYRMPTFSGTLTNFENFLSMSYKYNLFSVFFNLCFMICVSNRTLPFEILKKITTNFSK